MCLIIFFTFFYWSRRKNPEPVKSEPTLKRSTWTNPGPTLQEIQALPPGTLSVDSRSFCNEKQWSIVF